jgi:RNase adapter protein RapZ
VSEVSTPDEAQAPAVIRVAMSSFGFKFGVPAEAEWMVDARMVRNPFWVLELRPHTGLEESVREYVLGDPVASELIDHAHALLLWSARRFAERGRELLNVGVGCTGGRHRSVALVEVLAERLRQDGFEVKVSHRDIDKPDPRW